MNSTESKNSHSWWWDSHISPEKSKWLAENLEEVDQSVKSVLKLIEEDGDAFAEKAGMYNEKRPEFIAHVEGFYRMYRLLAERYDHLTEELRKCVPSLVQMQDSVISHSSPGQDTPFVTPNQKFGLNKFGKRDDGFDLFPSSGGSSDLSLKESSESSSLASDSESESFDSSINKHSNPHVTGDGKGPCQRLTFQENELLVGMHEVKVSVHENEDHAALLKRITAYEEELKESNKKLECSEEEVARLKSKKEAFTVLTSDLQAQLESAQRDIKMREADIEMEKRKVFELQKKVTDLEIQVSDSNIKIRTLVEELEIATEKLKFSEDEIGKMKAALCNEISKGTSQLQGQLELAQKDIATLEAKLDSEKIRVLELLETIVRNMADVSERDQEIKELNFALSNSQKTFSLDKAKLQSDISCLSEQLALSEAIVEESELRSKSFENKIRRCEAEKKEMKCLHEAQHIGSRSEIEQLKADVAERGELVEALNQQLDILKLKHDVLVSEKDKVNAKVQTLSAEMNSRDNQIQQLEVQLRQMHIESAELIIGSESAQDLVDELRLRVGELEKEVDRQRVLISERAEEKRDAIRQLCFALEHYRNGYQELRQAFVGHKRHAVLAS
ncbi:Protein NETWORKED 4A like [Actinidia chinensis var. chinensis]|uniref:Protein NETWORKED 4A like n=1 Tax=Actinidia chinensis var. chinensis TaxID=1590841 RepID=A0A2R6PLR6_ACTCC|nr:Protein NETWORKED 4A like [Actinidia chinensis var. chinensis]